MCSDVAGAVDEFEDYDLRNPFLAGNLVNTGGKTYKHGPGPLDVMESNSQHWTRAIINDSSQDTVQEKDAASVSVKRSSRLLGASRSGSASGVVRSIEVV